LKGAVTSNMMDHLYFEYTQTKQRSREANCSDRRRSSLYLLTFLPLRNVTTRILAAIDVANESENNSYHQQNHGGGK